MNASLTQVHLRFPGKGRPFNGGFSRCIEPIASMRDRSCYKTAGERGLDAKACCGDGKEFLRRMGLGARERQQVLVEIYAQLRKDARIICYQKGVLSPDDQADVLQETLERILLKWETFNGEGCVYRWTRAIMSNLAADLHRGRKRLVSVDESQSRESEDGDPPMPGLMDKADAYVDPAMRVCLERVLEILRKEPPARKGSMRAYDLIEFFVEANPSLKELSEFLGTSEGAAAERRSYVLKRVKELCLKHCGTEQCHLGS